MHVEQQHAAKRAVRETLLDFAAFADLLEFDAVGRAAVVFGDDHILYNVHKAAG